MALREDLKISLHSKELNQTVRMPVKQVENILNDPKNTPFQWALPESSKYQLSRGKIVVKRSAEEANGTQVPAGAN